MVMLPTPPQSWNDEFSRTQETLPSGPDNASGGLLGGLQSPDWSLENSGLGFLFHPQTIAQIDLGDGHGSHAAYGLADPITGNMAAQNLAVGPAQAPTAGHDNTNSAVFMTLPGVPNENATAKSSAAADGGSSRLGTLSARYESRGNPGTVSSGRNDRGGASYGTYQLATNTGDAAAFVASPEFRPWASEFEHLAPATTAFGNQWQAVAARDPETFQQAQHAYIRRTHYDPIVSQVNRNTGYDLDNASDAVRDAAWSTSVQHGTAARILTDALRRTDQASPRTDPNYESRLIDNIYDRRTELVKTVRDNAIADNQAANARNLNNVINNRYPQERADAQNMLRNQRGR